MCHRSICNNDCVIGQYVIMIGKTVCRKQAFITISVWNVSMLPMFIYMPLEENFLQSTL